MDTPTLRQTLKELQREWKELANELDIPNERFHDIDREIDVIEALLSERGAR
ncbi:MAG TPA: hypothetical protein VGN26_09115 [Armatimonadota bacterium]